MKLKIILPLLILLLAVGGFLALKATRDKPAPVVVQERVWHVATAPVVVQDLQPELVLYGRVETPDRVRVAAPVGGRVLKVLVRDGDQVSAGQALAELDARDLTPRVTQIQADIEREKINQQNDRMALKHEQEVERLAQQNLQRNETILKQNLGSAAATDAAREQVARARLAVLQREQAIAQAPARLAQLESKLAEAKRDAERGQMTAPFAARVGAVEVAAGDQVSPGQTLLTLYPSDALFLRTKLPAAYAEPLRLALSEGATLRAQVQVDDKPVPATLERLAGQADARGVDALLKLETRDAAITSGSLLQARLALPTQTQVVALPPSALHGESTVYAIKDGRLHAVQVERIGEMRRADNDLLLVRSPELRNGVEIMLTHLPNAIDGLAVKPLPQTATPSAQAL